MTRHGFTDPISSTSEGSSIRNSDISDITAATTQQSGGDTENSFATEAVQQIETVVESFRTNGIEKPQAIFRIGQILAADPRGDEKQKSESLARYASTLDGIETLASKSNERGLRLSNTALGKRKEVPDDGSQ